MELAKIRIGFPVFRYETLVTHYTPRVPTAFERILLQVHDRVAKNPEYSRVSLKAIFETVLGVPDPDAIVLPALQELIALDVFRTKADTGSLNSVLVQDLERTARGDEMIINNLLPARSRDDSVAHSYDPVRQMFLSESEDSVLRERAPEVVVDSAVFEDVYPEERIREIVPQEDHPWWHPSSRIDRVTRQTTECLWREWTGTIALTERGTLEIQFPKEELTSYVNSLEPGVVFQRFIRPAVLGTDNDLSWDGAFAQADWGLMHSRLSRIFPISRFKASLVVKPGVQFLKAVPGISDEPEKVPARSAIIVVECSGAPAEGQIIWNDDRNGVVIRVPDPFPVAGLICYDGKSTCFGASVFDLQIGRETVSVPLGYEYAMEHLPPEIPAMVDKLGNRLASSHGEDGSLACALFWSLSKTWEMLFRQARSTEGHFEEIAAKLQSWRKRIEELAGAQDAPNWDREVADLFEGWLKHQPQPIPLEALKVAVGVLAKCGLSDVDRLAELAQSAQARLRQPETWQDLEAIASALEPLGAAGHIPYPSSLFTSTVLADMLNRYGTDGFLPSGQNRNSLEMALMQLRPAEMLLTHLTGLASLRDVKPDAFGEVLRATRDVAALEEACTKWQGLFAELVALGPPLTELVPKSPVGKVDDSIRGLQGCLKVFGVQVPQGFSRVYIIDTSVFLQQPNILPRFRKDEFVVVSKRVIEELDDKKQDKDLRPSVALATRFLREAPQTRVQFADANPELLPPDYRMKGDNLILSVAIMYRRHQPVLVTEDNNLALKAKAEGIKVMSLKEFDGRDAQKRALTLPLSRSNDSRRKANDRPSRKGKRR